LKQLQISNFFHYVTGPSYLVFLVRNIATTSNDITLKEGSI